ncbi:hypothetical protein K4K49_009156 [Colletotrichum sp. SAR 10_70]|nr:hypothetical protein K4K50_009156 [Colletotrichum sp. SAR 10_71]KAI8155719.1 hypothetical protein K4K49_009156 [Colletotrichum sp. SAR 10_70]
MLGRTYFFRADIDFPKGGAPSTKHYTRDLAARRPDDPSPRLCARCQDWDVPEFAAGRGAKAHYYLPLAAVLRAGSGCLDMRIVQPFEPVRFVALSYMWEASEGAGHAQLVNANAEDLGAEGSLSSVSLPRIITDTISLCRDLGERYLWVDRLCIVQDDERSKPDQIDGMDRIYRSAAFAIMAALDDRTGKGLPGYIDERRPRASLWGPPRNRNSRRGIDPNGVQAIVDPSLWNRRGWTFQERLFTKRRLFITEYQVLFECCRAQAAEELTWGPPLEDDPYHSPVQEADPEDDHDCGGADADAGAGQESEKRKNRHSFGTGFYCKPRFGKSTTIQLQDHIMLADYCLWVENYTPRALSHGGDVLNAFAGVGNAVKKAMKTEVMYGLPATCLPQALMWSHTGRAARREETAWIPSWSWAGWVGKAGYRWIHGEEKLNDSKLVRVVTLVAFHFQDPGRGLGRVGVRERWLGMEMRKMNIISPDKLPKLQRRMSGGRISVSEETDRMYEEMWNRCPHSPWEALARPGLDPAAVEIAGDFPGCLVFDTTVASLRIGRDHRRSGTRAAAGEFEDAEILDVMGRQVGYLDKMDPEWIAGRKGKRDRRRMLDFIVISAGLQEATSERGQWAFIEGQFHELWQFNVMLVERLPYEQFVARRVGVGCVRIM